MTLHVWRALCADASVRWLSYSFGPGTASSLAVRDAAGSWCVVSPPRAAPDRVLEELAESGEVRALIAPNAYHHLGQARWRARFPQARSYAASAALPRLHEQSDVRYEPLEELTDAAAISCVLPAGQKAPDALLRFAADGGHGWWLGDLFSNLSRADQSWPLRLLARLAGSGLGYRCNARPEWVYVRDRAAWLDSVETALRAHPPQLVVPAHGDPVSEQTSERTFAALAAIRK